jgi:hypothetical protein
MGKRSIEKAKNSNGKKMSRTGKLPLVESLTNKGCMVRPKVRKAQESRGK